MYPTPVPNRYRTTETNPMNTEWNTSSSGAINELNIDPRKVLWKRVLDMNDRALRNIVVGLAERPNGVPREVGFDVMEQME